MSRIDVSLIEADVHSEHEKSDSEQEKDADTQGCGIVHETGPPNVRQELCPNKEMDLAEDTIDPPTDNQQINNATKIAKASISLEKERALEKSKATKAFVTANKSTFASKLKSSTKAVVNRNPRITRALTSISAPVKPAPARKTNAGLLMTSQKLLVGGGNKCASKKVETRR